MEGPGIRLLHSAPPEDDIETMTNVKNSGGSLSLRNAVFLIVVVTLLVGVGPAGWITSRQLERTLEAGSRDDILRAAEVLRDRWRVSSDMRMMHAQDLAGIPDLERALATGSVEAATSVVEAAAQEYSEYGVLVDTTGRLLVGPSPIPTELIQSTRLGEMPVAVVDAGEGPHVIALAPVTVDGRWMGAAGGATPYDVVEAGILAGLTRSGVIIVGGDNSVSATTLDEDVATELSRLLSNVEEDIVHALSLGPLRFLALRVTIDRDVRVAFVRNLDEELGVVPTLKKTALAVSAGALAVGLILGGLFAQGVANPVMALADAADSFATGNEEVPVEKSAIKEVGRLADVFKQMRRTLIRRMDELKDANAGLEDRQRKLTLLQAELVSRERASATGQLVTQLAHEIRNPIASVRNCLEVLRRRVAGDKEGEEFADLAIDELLRMHELAEQMLDMNRPRAKGESRCDTLTVAKDVAMLADAGSGTDRPKTVVTGDPATADIPRDALKQALFNVVLNAKEASGKEGQVEIRVKQNEDHVTISVFDDGPGIEPDLLPTIFDPFVTTKAAVRGVGLGLFMSDATLRMFRSRITARNRADMRGAIFQIELPSTTEGNSKDE